MLGTCCRFSPTLQLHSDVDRGEGRTKYLLTGEGAGTVFVIDEATGNIHVTKSLDREEKAQYVLLAQAVDRASNRPLEPPSEFIIKVQDINDNPPIFPLGPYHATVPEMSNVGEYPNSDIPDPVSWSTLTSPSRIALVSGSPSFAVLSHLALPLLSGVPGSPTGTSVIQVTAHDADDPSYGNSAKLVYTVLDGLPFFSVDPQTGEDSVRSLVGQPCEQAPPDPSCLPRSGAYCHPQHGPGDAGGVLGGDSGQGHGRPHGGAVGQHYGDGHPQRCQRQPPQVPSE